MPTLKLTLPRPHKAQQQIINESKRFNAVDCGRRFGKTKLGVNRAADPQVLAYPVGWFSPTYKMLLEVWRETSQALKPITQRRNVQERRLEYVTGGLLEFWSLDNPDAARGRRYKRIIVDEAAMIPNLLDAWNMVLRPTLADFEGDGWFLSTPKGRNGFWHMFTWGQDTNNGEWASWKMPTSANPFIPASEIEAMRRTMPELIFAQEVLAEFLEDAGGVFRRVVESATATAQQSAVDGHEYIIGVDWGKSADFTVLTVLDTTTNEVVALDRFNQIDYTVQVGRLKAMAERFRPYSIIAEKNSIGEPLIEQLYREGLPVQPFQTTNATKATAIDALALAFERGELRILNDAVLIAELQAYEMERLPSGLMRYSAPAGMHDDCVISLALAWQGAINKPVTNVLENPFW